MSAIAEPLNYIQYWCTYLIIRKVFISYILTGAYELHRNGIIHGRLHSNNCVIDNRWVCKITDYGMDKFKQTHHNNNQEDETEYQKYRSKSKSYSKSFSKFNNGVSFV